jgi:hypothetical protein
VNVSALPPELLAQIEAECEAYKQQRINATVRRHDEAARRLDREKKRKEQISRDNAERELFKRLGPLVAADRDAKPQLTFSAIAKKYDIETWQARRALTFYKHALAARKVQAELDEYKARFEQRLNVVAPDIIRLHKEGKTKDGDIYLIYYDVLSRLHWAGSRAQTLDEMFAFIEQWAKAKKES